MKGERSMNDVDFEQPTGESVRRAGRSAFSLGLMFGLPFWVLAVIYLAVGPTHLDRAFASPFICLPGLLVMLAAVFVLLRRAWAVNLLKTVAILCAIALITATYVLIAAQNGQFAWLTGAWAVMAVLLIAKLAHFKQVIHTAVEGDAFAVIIPEATADAVMRSSDGCWGGVK